MDRDVLYYKPSGKTGMLATVQTAIAGFLGAIVLGGIYGYFIHYCPLIYINFLITIGFGACMGFAVSSGAKWGKVRNTLQIGFYGLFFGIIAAYAGWVSWFLAISGQKALLLEPQSLFKAIQIIAQEGAWSIKGSTPTGFVLYAIWGVEAAIIVGMTTLIPLGILGSIPFCEECNIWVEEQKEILPLEVTETLQNIVPNLEQGDFSDLEALEQVPEDSSAYVQLNLIHCSGCEVRYYLTVLCIVIEIDKDGDPQKKETTLVENLIINKEIYERLSAPRSFKQTEEEKTEENSEQENATPTEN